MGENDSSGKEPNIENLRTYIAENGNVIKNFKALCEILEIPYINKGKGFKTQREELGCFIKWRKDGHKILVEEIYETPFRIVKNQEQHMQQVLSISLLICLKMQ